VTFQALPFDAAVIIDGVFSLLAAKKRWERSGSWSIPARMSKSLELFVLEGVTDSLWARKQREKPVFAFDTARRTLI